METHELAFAIIQIKGHQYKVSERDTVLVSYLGESKEGDTLDITDVLLVAKGDEVKIGTPHVAGTKVKVTVEKHTQGEKIRVSRFKAKSRYRKTTGIRPKFTQIRITSIGK